MKETFLMKKIFLPFLLSSIFTSSVFGSTIYTENDQGAAPHIISIVNEGINYSVELGKNYTRIGKKSDPNSSENPDEKCILPEKIAHQVADELGNGIEKGSWKTLSGTEFLSWWENLESNQHTPYLKGRLGDNGDIDSVDDYVSVEQDGLIYSINKALGTAEVSAIKLDKNSYYEDNLPSIVLGTRNSDKKLGDSSRDDWKSIPGAELMELWKSSNDFSDSSKPVRIASSVEFEGISYRVESISDSCFEGCKDITYVIVPSSVKNIGYKSFANCLSLKSVIFEKTSSLECIGESAFENSGIEFISLPKSLLSIDKFAFSNCNNLKILTIESPIVSVNVHAFNNCKNLSDVSVPCNFPIENFFHSCLRLKDPEKFPNSFDILKISYSNYGLMTEKKVGNGTIHTTHSFSDWTNMDNNSGRMRSCEFCNLSDSTKNGILRR